MPSFVIHNDKEIKGFFGPYRFLSNFYYCPVYFEGLCYPSSEHAYQAGKVVEEERRKFLECTPAQAKKLWKECTPNWILAEDIEKYKYLNMVSIVFEKIIGNDELRKKLLETGDRYLEETNNWHDNYWGVCNCQKCKSPPDNWIEGHNNLGKILMKVRDFWK